MSEFRCTDPEGEWIQDQQNFLRIALACKDEYKKDPVHVTHWLIGEYGKDGAREVIKWIESVECNPALKIEDSDTPDAA